MNKAAVGKIGFFSGLALFCMIFFLDEIPGLSRSGQITLCVFLLMGIWWATEALPLPITSLLPLVLFPLFGVAEIGVISKEFMNKVQFLFAGGFMIAIAMQKWNLHRRVALTILQYSDLSGKKIVASFMGISALLSMWVMNTSTTIMLLPIAVSVCYVICDTVKGISEKERGQSSSLCIVRNSIFLINRWNCYTNWDRTEWFFDSVFSQRKYRHRIY